MGYRFLSPPPAGDAKLRHVESAVPRRPHGFGARWSSLVASLQSRSVQTLQAFLDRWWLVVSLTAGLVAADPVNVLLVRFGVEEGMHDPREMAQD